MSKIIIGLVGRQGAGKGTVAEYLHSRYSAEIFRFSTVLTDILNRLAIEKTRENLIMLSETLRKKFGEDVLAYAIEKDTHTTTADRIVIDGIRRIEDLTVLEPLPQFKLVEIVTPEKTRFERITHRGEKSGEREMTYEKFSKQEQASTEIMIPSVAARAWKTIHNNGTQSELMSKIDDLMDELGMHPKI